VFWVLFLAVILAIGLSLALIINFIPSKAELASGDYVGARGLAWPWTVPQAIFVSAYIINLLLAYGFVQYYTGWTHDVQHYVHAVALSICLTLLIWLETFPAGAECTDHMPAPAEGSPLLSEAKQKDNLFLMTHVWYWCDKCRKFVVGKHRRHCRTCKRCSIGFDHHCQYMNICIAAYNYTAWFTAVVLWFVVLIFQLVSTITLAVNLDNDNSSEYERLSRDLGMPLGCVLLTLAMAMQVTMLVFFSDLVVLHSRLIIQQKVENWRAAREDREPEFICTLSMMGIKHDDQAKRKKLETAALLLELHCTQTPARPSAVFRVLQQRAAAACGTTEASNSIHQAMRGIASEPTTDWPLPTRPPPSPTTRPELKIDFGSRSPSPLDVVVRVNVKHEWSGELGEVFRLFDTDGDGFVKNGELQNTLQSLGKERSQQELDKMIRYMNNNGDGKVNFEEFCEVMTNQKEDDIIHQELVEVFRTFDLDQSGRVTLTNLKEMRDKLGEEASDDEMEQMIKWAAARTDDDIVDVDEGLTQNQFIQAVSPSSSHDVDPFKLTGLGLRPRAGGRTPPASHITLPPSPRLSYHELTRIRKEHEDSVNASMPGGWGIAAPKAKVYT